MVECQLPKLNAAGSIPVACSIYKKTSGEIGSIGSFYLTNVFEDQKP